MPSEELKRRDDRQEPSRVEKAFMAAAAIFTAALFGYAVWHAVAAPEAGEPMAQVTSTRPMEGGGVIVEVDLVNPLSRGLLSADVEVDCGDPAPELSFTWVPAGGRESATFVCPPGTTEPEARVTKWMTT